MAVTFFPFNSIVVGGVADRPANAENLAAYLAGFFSNGVLMQQDTSLQVSVSSGMNVQIHAGVGNINGKTILNTAAEIVPIEAASLTLDRIDRVIFRLDEVNRLMEFDVLKGTAASSPTAPALTQGADIYEMCLAEVRVPAGASEIIASYITDKRADSALCGYSSIPGHMQDIAYGGTGANTAAGALANLGMADSGWVDATLSSRFSRYATDTPCQYRKIGKHVQIRGVVKPTATIAGSATDYPIFTLPEGYRPSVSVYSVCQGSGKNTWLLRVYTDGTVNFSRYGTTSNAEAGTSTWLPFDVGFLID